MSISEELAFAPHLTSPAALARADLGHKFQLPPHLAYLDRELVLARARPDGRLMVNMPFGHGKSLESSIFFPAWVMLLWPETRIILVAATEALASTFGLKVKDVVERFGPDLGVHLREDSQAKGLWNIQGHNGGMLCRGVGGSILGYHAELMIIDDLIKDEKQAMSGAALEGHWNWYQAIVEGRLMPGAPIILVGTRWGRNDIFGCILREEESLPAELKEGWRVVKLKGIAEADDPLGRKPGEPLWPARRSLRRLQRAQRGNRRWFRASYQQEPEEEKGLWYQPYDAEGRLAWPTYKDIGDAYSLDVRGARRRVRMHGECIRIVTMDWAWGKKKTSDFTAAGAYAITPTGDALTLEVLNERWRPEELAPELEKFCIRWAPSLVAVETGHPTLANDYRRFKGIPEIRWLTTRGANKLARALQAIVMSQNGKVYIPENHAVLPWVKPFLDQLSAFTGDENAVEHDDMQDQLAYMAVLAQQLRGAPLGAAGEPEVLTPGKEQW